MEDDGGQFLISPVDVEIRDAMRAVVRYLEKAHKIKATKLSIRKLKKSTALWMANMSCKDEKDFTYELTNRNGHIILWWEFVKWALFMSNHTLIALLTAAFERFAVKRGSEKHVKLMQESRDLYQEFQVFCKFVYYTDKFLSSIQKILSQYFKLIKNPQCNSSGLELAPFFFAFLSKIPRKISRY